MGQHWAISTYVGSKCHTIPNEQVDEHVLVDNEQIIIPEIALIAVNEEKALACDRFIIPQARTKIDTSINLIYNESIHPSYDALINLKEILDNEPHWEKLPYIPSDMQAIIDFISSAPKPASIKDIQIWRDHPISWIAVAFIGSLVLVIIVLLFSVFAKKRSQPETRTTLWSRCRL